MNAVDLIIDFDTRLATNPKMVLRIEADDCGLLFDPDSGSVQMLNDTAIHIWQQLDGRRTLGEILEATHQLYNDMPAEAGQQVLALVRHLADLGAVGVWENG